MWLLEEDFRLELFERFETMVRPGDDVLATFNASATETKNVGAVAQISIHGVLTKEPDAFMRWLGYDNTVYSELIGAIAAANNDPRVDTIDLMVDSPGGEVANDFYEAMDAIHNSEKPVRAIVKDIAASAAFGLVSQASEIVAVGRGVRVGSVGVVRTIYKDRSTKEITSTDAPNKRPNPETEEGMAAIQGELDEMHEMFVSTIARGRKTTAETINKDFGRGGMLLAEEALGRNMIDAIGVESSEPVSKEYSAMDIEKLNAEHPEVYQAVMAQGVEKERGRVQRHLKLGKTSGAMDVALGAIEKGDELTDDLQTDYMVANMKNQSKKSRQQESDETAGAMDGANEGDNADLDKQKAADDAFCSALSEEYGLKGDE